MELPTVVETLDIKEIDELREGAEMFFSAAGLRGAFNMEHFKQCWQTYYALKIGRIFVIRDVTGKVIAGLGCVCVPDLYTGNLVATELFWFVFPDHRGIGLELLDIYEKWARDEGCSEIRMIHLPRLMPDRLKRLYQRRGYRELEVAYGKEA